MKQAIINPKDKSVIYPSNTWLYYKTTKVDAGQQVEVWKPYTLEQINSLETIKLALQGSPTHLQSKVWQSTFIRFGWLDENLNSLRWIPIDEVLKEYFSKSIDKRTRAKLNHVCRLLFISTKDIKNA